MNLRWPLGNAKDLVVEEKELKEIAIDQVVQSAKAAAAKAKDRDGFGRSVLDWKPTSWHRQIKKFCFLNFSLIHL